MYEFCFNLTKITLTKVKIQYMSSPVLQRVTDLFVLHLMAGRNIHDFVCMCVYVRERKNEQLPAVRKLGVQVPQKENNFVSIAVYFFSVVASKSIKKNPTEIQRDEKPDELEVCKHKYIRSGNFPGAHAEHCKTI